ncbi:MAG: hypothetical protein H7A36_04070 [Chlamydiales bacterium]|nr:hypothetical protein [Chlamydiales bacterium]
MANPLPDHWLQQCASIFLPKEVVFDHYGIRPVAGTSNEKDWVGLSRHEKYKQHLFTVSQDPFIRGKNAEGFPLLCFLVRCFRRDDEQILRRDRSGQIDELEKRFIPKRVHVLLQKLKEQVQAAQQALAENKGCPKLQKKYIEAHLMYLRERVAAPIRAEGEISAIEMKQNRGEFLEKNKKEVEESGDFFPTLIIDQPVQVSAKHLALLELRPLPNSSPDKYVATSRHPQFRVYHLRFEVERRSDKFFVTARKRVDVARSLQFEHESGEMPLFEGQQHQLAAPSMGLLVARPRNFSIVD